MTSDDILFLFHDYIHPVHEQWGESIGAEFYDIERGGLGGFFDRKILEFRNYDVVLTESSFGLRIAALFKDIFSYDLYRLIADEGYYKINNGGPRLKGEIWASRRLDGAIAVSEWIKQEADSYIEAPIKVVNPFIEEWMYEGLKEADRGLNKNFLFVGDQYKVKGIDLIYNAAKILENREKEANFEIVGKQKLKDYTQDTPNLNNNGYLEDGEEFLEMFSQATFFLQPSRGDSCPVATLEAMRAGLIPIVSEANGCKEFVARVDENLICRTDKESLADTIEYAASLEKQEKVEYAEKFFEMSNDFEKSKKLAEFKEKFNELR